MEDTIRIIIDIGLVVGLAIMFAYFVYLLIIQFKYANIPTWKGIIIRAILGCLPFYLVLCYLGYIGKKKMLVMMNNLQSIQVLYFSFIQEIRHLRICHG